MKWISTLLKKAEELFLDPILSVIPDPKPIDRNEIRERASRPRFMTPEERAELKRRAEHTPHLDKMLATERDSKTPLH